MIENFGKIELALICAAAGFALIKLFLWIWKKTHQGKSDSLDEPED